MKVLSIIGARPQFIKEAVVGAVLRKRGVERILVDTGQHYDANMREVFFGEMDIPAPAHVLKVGSGSHAYQTGEAMMRLEQVCVEEKPNVIMVYGDTNATIAGALVGSKLCIEVAHVEAGLRSFDRTMPEEVNRVVTDHISNLLFCPTETAVKNLAAEGVVDGVHNVGDVMYDAAIMFGCLAEEKSDVLNRLRLEKSGYVLVTIHRDFNTDDSVKLGSIVDGLVACEDNVVFPAHPRVRKQLEAFGLLKVLENKGNIQIIEPVGYLDMVSLEKNARVIVTDSGGVQKEAFFHKVPCITVRPSTEWVETVLTGWNNLVNTDCAELVSKIKTAARPAVNDADMNFYGDGKAGEKIVDVLVASIAKRCPPYRVFSRELS